MAERFLHIPGTEDRLWSAAIVVYGVTFDVDPRDGRYFNAKMEAMEDWARDPEQVGQFACGVHDSYSVWFRFTHPDTALAFKMRWV